MYVYVCCSIFRKKKHKHHVHNLGEYLYEKHLIDNKLKWKSFSFNKTTCVLYLNTFIMFCTFLKVTY